MSTLNIDARYREPAVLIVPSVAGFPVVLGSARTRGRCRLSTMLGLATTAAVLWLTMVPCADAAAAGYPISATRAAAIHACSVLASRYPQHDWGNTEIHQYRSCMAVHGQRE